MNPEIKAHYEKAVEGLNQMPGLYFGSRVRAAQPETVEEYNKVVDGFKTRFKLSEEAVSPLRMAEVKKTTTKKKTAGQRKKEAEAEAETDSE